MRLTSLSEQAGAGTGEPAAHLCNTCMKAFIPKVAEQYPGARLPACLGCPGLPRETPATGRRGTWVGESLFSSLSLQI